MAPRLRKFVLTTHIVCSVGWLGAIVPYLALAMAGITSHDPQMAGAAYLSLEVIGWFVIVPFGLAALLTGLVQALGTQWGLFRHWWVVVKFLLTALAIAILLLHMQDVSRVSRMVKGGMLSSAAFRPELIHAAGGLLVVLAAAVISVFKPWGMTPYGSSRVSQPALPSRPSDTAYAAREPAFATSGSRWRLIVGIHAAHAIGIAVILVLILHLTGGGLHHH